MTHGTSKPALRHLVIPVTRARQNCSLIWCPETLSGAAIDPGGDLHLLRDAADDRGVSIDRILVTHGHCDHAGGVADLAEDLQIPIYGPHRDDLFWLRRLDDIGEINGMDWARCFRPDHWLEDGAQIAVGRQTVSAIHCPGHTPGHIVYFSATARLLFAGDVLFKGLIGTTELPKGDHLELLRSILGKLWPLGDDVIVVPGHGERTTIGDERRHNACVSDERMAPYVDRLFATAVTS